MGATGSIEYTVGEPMRGTKWVVRGKLGQGGMGLVLDVVKARLIPGAMKVLLPPFANAPEFAAKFLDEVKVTARLQHPNVVQVLDFDRLEDGTPFMVMERLRGRTLRAALRETQQNGRTWTPANAYAVAAQVAQGLYRAHSHDPSIVHRDIKPENIYLHRAEGTLESMVKVMDFGIAAVVGERDRQCIGTPRYMAPEQVAGDPVSPQTDQYALALVVYEMLTGRFPWEVNLRDVSALVDVHRRVAPTPPSRFCPWLPERIDAALLKALSKDPAARHDTVHGLVFELRALQSIDRSNAAGDVHATDPMVGTLADGGAVLREEPDTFGRMPAPSFIGPSLDVPDAERPERMERRDLPTARAACESPSPRRPQPWARTKRPDLASSRPPAASGPPPEPEARTEAPDERIDLGHGAPGHADDGRGGAGRAAHLQQDAPTEGPDDRVCVGRCRRAGGRPAERLEGRVAAGAGPTAEGVRHPAGDRRSRSHRFSKPSPRLRPSNAIDAPSAARATNTSCVGPRRDEAACRRPDGRATRRGTRAVRPSGR